MLVPKWIWNQESFCSDSYVRFKKTFALTNLNNITISLSCDTYFNLYINGKLVSVGWFYDYENYKGINSYDITKFCKKNENIIEIVVWHIGVHTFCCTIQQPGLWFCIKSDNNVIAISDENVLCKKEFGYKQNLNKYIGTAVGLSFEYDANDTEQSFSNAVISDKNSTFTFDNANLKNISTFPSKHGKIKKVSSSNFLVDFSKEYWGYFSFKLKSKTNNNKITIYYSEHLVNDRTFGAYPSDRDFSVTFIAKKGENVFSNLLRSIGFRYLEFEAENDIIVKKVSVIPVGYPLSVKPFSAKTPLQQKIYDISIYTLQCCTGVHYMDCPWREQSSYILDARNQMLYGYYAFNDFEFARYNLLFFANSLNENGLIPNCPPGGTRVIPFFDLVYIIAVKEYIHYTNDLSILPKVEKALDSIINVFISKICDNGLISHFEKNCWNFYEWVDGNDNWLENSNDDEVRCNTFDVILNSMFVIALEQYIDIKHKLSKNFDFDVNYIKKSIKNTFFDKEKKMFFNSNIDKRFSKLGNGIAILAGVLSKNENSELAKKLISSNEVVDISLSAVPFFYDALLSVDNSYAEYIKNDIITKYKYMLDKGATTFWETLGGAEDFGGSGSLCHGWSAAPVYYFSKFNSENFIK